MLKPSFRFFIIPLGAVATLASLSGQNIAPRAQRDTGSMIVREQVVDCSTRNASEVCVIRATSLQRISTSRPVSHSSNLPSNLQRPGRDAPQPGRSAFGLRFMRRDDRCT